MFFRYHSIATFSGLLHICCRDIPTRENLVKIIEKNISAVQTPTAHTGPAEQIPMQISWNQYNFNPVWTRRDQTSKTDKSRHT